MTETRHLNGSDLDNRHRFGARARHAGDSPTAACTTDIRALARSLRSGLQARVYKAWICYRKASARGSSEIAARSPGMVVVGAVVAVVAPTSPRAFPVIYIQRRRSGMALVYPTEPSREIGYQREGRLWGVCHERTVWVGGCGTVREMKEGPSRPAVRCRSQATASCCRQERWWCCVKKVRERHAVREMKEDPSEPSCRGRLQTAMSCFGQKLR